MLSLISQIVSIVAGAIIIFFGFMLLWFWIYTKKAEIDDDNDWEYEDGDDL